MFYLETQGIVQFLDYSSRILEEAREAKVTGQISGYQPIPIGKWHTQITKGNKINHPKLSKLS